MKELLENLLNERVDTILKGVSNKEKEKTLKNQQNILKEIKTLLPKECQLLNDLEEITLKLEWIELLNVYKEALKDANVIKKLF